MTITEISEKLTAAGCEINVWRDERVYVGKTPNGSRGQYGYCVAGRDVQEVTEHISKRQGEVRQILRG